MKSRIKIILFLAFVLVSGVLPEPASAGQLFLKLKTVGTLPAGDLVGGWQATVLLPASGVTIKTVFGSNQLDPASFYASGVTPATFKLFGSYNGPDTTSPTYPVPSLILATLDTSNLVNGTQSGQVATLVLETAAASPVLTKNDFSLVDTVISRAAAPAGVVVGISFDFDLSSSNTTSKPGDCDASDTVTIAEVQSAINMFLGLKTVEGCVDTSGDNSVSIAEVQKTINSFLGL